jgi:hypothetical protein
MLDQAIDHSGDGFGVFANTLDRGYEVSKWNETSERGPISGALYLSIAVRLAWFGFGRERLDPIQHAEGERFAAGRTLTA